MFFNQFLNRTISADFVLFCGGDLVAKSCSTLVTPWTVALQVSGSMGFSRQEYWSGLPFPSPGDLSDPGNESRFPALLVAQRLKRLPSMRETWVRSLGREDLLEKEMAIHSSIFA